jgi:starch-binding outer membrane protein, SusD/RagB family
MFKITQLYKWGYWSAVVVLLICAASSCKKFVTIDPPHTSLIDQTVFSKEQTATAAVLDIYFTLCELFGSPNGTCLSKANALYTDEYTAVSIMPAIQSLYQNSLESRDQGLAFTWGEAYKAIYKANAAIEGIEKFGKSIPFGVKNQLTGEAKFLRAVSYFLLVNMFGDIPVLLTTDYNTNRAASRSTNATVYAQILEDLSGAKELVGTEFIDGTNLAGGLRVRANKDVVTAMQAKVYLYLENWEKAEEYASELINNTGLFSLEQDLTNVFSVNSKESVWGFYDKGWQYPFIGINYILMGPPYAEETPFGIGNLSDELMNRFEPGDLRKDKWVGKITDATGTFFFPYKYRDISWDQPVAQLQSAIRLGELYLIRAEARIQQNHLEDGIADLNMIRSRARAQATPAIPDPLPALDNSLSKTAAMLALEQERMIELFTEGHRFFDLKRWKGVQDPTMSRADELMPGIAAAKGATWYPYKKLFPIPQNEIDLNVNLEQNPEY